MKKVSGIGLIRFHRFALASAREWAGMTILPAPFLPLSMRSSATSIELHLLWVVIVYGDLDLTMPRRSNGKDKQLPADWLMAYRCCRRPRTSDSRYPCKQSGVVRDRVRAIEWNTVTRFLQLQKLAGG